MHEIIVFSPHIAFHMLQICFVYQGGGYLLLFLLLGGYGCLQVLTRNACSSPNMTLYSTFPEQTTWYLCLSMGLEVIPYKSAQKPERYPTLRSTPFLTKLPPRKYVQIGNSRTFFPPLGFKCVIGMDYWFFSPASFCLASSIIFLLVCELKPILSKEIQASICNITII